MISTLTETAQFKVNHLLEVVGGDQYMAKHAMVY